MDALITEALNSEAEFRVIFECACGRGSALWHGPAPLVGDRRFVELEIESPLILGKDLMVTDEPKGLRVDDGGTLLIGDVTLVEENGLVRLDFGCGGIELEIAGVLPVPYGRYRVIAPALKAFDCDY